MPARWLIVADDLTGAADCAIAFVKQGLHANVRWGALTAAIDDDVLVDAYDANSRALGAVEAVARHRDVLGALLRPDRHVFKKIDSTLRGQPAAELAATLDVIRARSGAAFGVMAPAFPATRRTTERGRICVDGAPLEQAEVWRREHSYPTAFLPDVLGCAGIRSRLIDLATVRAGDEALRAALRSARADGAEIAVADALTSEDLERIVAAALPLAADPSSQPGLFWIGTAGLAHALAAASPATAASAPAMSRRGGGTLVVVGSMAAASRSSARRLAGLEGVRHVRIDAELLKGQILQEKRDARRDMVLAGLEAGDDVLVEIASDDDMSLDPRIVEGLAALLEPAAAAMGGVVATGGETAAALFGRFGIDGLRLVDEIEPGVTLGLTLGRYDVPAITKAGAFGDEGTLMRAVQRLREIGRKGVVS